PPLSAAPAKDPKIVALANAAAKCKFEDNYFDDECKAYKAWKDEEKLFEEGKGDLTILAMLEDKDVKIRVLASDKGFDSFEKIAGDKANAARIFADAKTETHPTVARSLGSYVARIDSEKLGMEADLKALAKLPSVELRDALAFHLYASKQTPLRLEITKQLLADSEPKVQSSALKGLSMGAARGKAPEACKLMGEQISRPDSDALWQVGTSGCTSVFDALAAELLKRSTDPAKAAKDGVSLSLAIGSMCRDGNAAQKTKGFTAAKALTDTKVKNVNARTAGVSSLAACDKVAAKPVLTALAKDGDKYVAERATKELAALDKK
ncbi:MAG: hypothetical protein ACXVCJ_27105, partial [Polyangiales bacterium]